MLEKIPVSVNVNLEIPEAILTAIYFFLYLKYTVCLKSGCEIYMN